MIERSKKNMTNKQLESYLQLLKEAIKKTETKEEIIELIEELQDKLTK